MEVVGLIKTSENSNACVKFRKKSIILDDILDFQRSPFDKSSLGYNSGKENSVADTWKPSKYEEIPSFSKSESQVAPRIPTKDIIKFRGYQVVSPTPQSKFRKETSSRWKNVSRYENNFNGYFYSCYDFSSQGIGLQILCKKKC